MRATPLRPAPVLAGLPTRRYSLHVGILQSPALIACAALAASCAPAVPQVPVTTPVSVSRVISEDVPPRPSGCAIETLTAMPSQPYRELGAIEVPGGDLNRRNTLLMIDQNACAMGADAIVVGGAQAHSRSGALEVTAIAYASDLATRAAQASGGATDNDAAEDDSRSPMAQLPQAQSLPMAAPDESSSSPDSSEPGAGSAPMTEQAIGPAEAPSPTPAASPSARPEAAPANRTAPTPTPTPAATATLAPARSPTPTPSPTYTATPTPAPAAIPAETSTPVASPTAAAPTAEAPVEETPAPSATATPSPAVHATPTASPSPALSDSTEAPALPLSFFKIVPEDVPDTNEAPDAGGSPAISPASSAAATTGPSRTTTLPATPSPSPSMPSKVTPPASADATP